MLALEPDAGAPQQFERRLTPDHQEDRIVLDLLGAPISADEDDRVPANLVHAAIETHLDPRGAAHAVLEPSQRLERLSLRSPEVVPAVSERHACARLGERDRGLERGIASAHHQHSPAAEIARIVEAAIDVLPILARDPKPAEIAGATDRDQHVASDQRRLTRQMHHHARSAALDALRTRPERADAGARHLLPQLVQQCFLHAGAHLEIARGSHRARVGEDRLAPGDVDQGRERLGRFEHLEAQAGLGCLESGAHPGHPGADHDEIQLTGRRRPRRNVAGDPASHARAPVERELEQRNAAQVAGDEYAGDAGRPVRAQHRQRFGGARRPPGVKPSRVTGNRSQHETSRNESHQGAAHHSQTERRAPSPLVESRAASDRGLPVSVRSR